MIEYRNARQNDLTTLIDLLADDPLGRKREDTSRPLNENYERAFEAILSNDQNQLIVAEAKGQLIAMCQLTYIPYLTHKGGWRCLIEGVRVCSSFRGQGVGKKLITHAVGLAKTKNCLMVQLTSDKSRADAIRFYERLGFRSTHEGLKLYL